MVRENVQFETALLVSVLLHTALLGGWEHRTAVARLPVVGPLVKVLTPRPKPPPALARTQDAPDPVITFVEEKVPPEQKPPHTAAPESTPPSPQPPRRFIETDSSQVTGEKPKETDLHSDRATVAANPENPTGKIGSTPYLDGTETRMLSTADVVPKLGPPGSPLPPRPPAAPTPTAPASTPAPATALPTPMLKPVELPPRNPETTARLQPSPQTKPVSNPEQPPPSLSQAETRPQSEQKTQPQPPSSVANEGLSSAPEPKPKITELPKEPGQTAQQLSEPKPDTQLAMVTVPDTSQPAPPSPGAPPVPQTPPAEPELTLQPPASPTPAQPPSGPATAGGGSGTPGTAGAESEREIGARKSRLTSVGVSRIGVAAFDVAESPFGAYDKAIVRAVQSRWYALIEKNALYERAGEVTIYFQLLPDGSVTNATVKSTTAGEILALFCQKAIVESAPFGPWPEEVRAYVGNEPRDVYFTFYY